MRAARARLAPVALPLCLALICRVVKGERADGLSGLRLMGMPQMIATD